MYSPAPFNSLPVQQLAVWYNAMQPHQLIRDSLPNAHKKGEDIDNRLSTSKTTEEYRQTPSPTQNVLISKS